MARPPLLGKEGKAPRLSTSRFIHVFSPCSKNSLVLIFLLQASRDRSGNPVFDHFRRRKSFVSDDEFLKIGLSGSISRNSSGKSPTSLQSAGLGSISLTRLIMDLCWE